MSMMLPKDTSTQESSEDVSTFKEFEDDDRSDNGQSVPDNNEDEDDYDAMLTTGRQTKTLEKGKTGSKSKRGNIRKDPKAIITQDQNSCM